MLYRLYYRLRRPRVDASVINYSLASLKLQANLAFIPKAQSYLSGGSATFLNHTVEIAKSTVWNERSQEMLWLYNLHYFDALNAVELQQRQQALQLLNRWTSENPPFDGVGWQPFPISLRIVNAVKYAASGHAFSDEINISLFLQARYLNKICEYHLLGNHLFENFKALCFAGLYFNCKEAEQWLSKGIAGINKELNEQILNDGGHFELSTMYHNIILEGLLDLQLLFSASNDAPAFLWHQQVKSMLRWLVAMQRPNNEISYFNDAANGVAATPNELFGYAQTLGYEIPAVGGPVVYLSDSGYLILQNQEAKVIIDIAKIGPAYLPGHGHADALAFELYLAGYPIFVNLGTSCYGTSSRRQFERSTAAHNTVVVDDASSSEVWAGFRVARRANVDLIALDKMRISAQAQHDGYARLHSRLKHLRSWRLETNTFEITDKLTCQAQQAEAFLHLHPNCKIIKQDKRGLTIAMPNAQIVDINISANYKIIDSEYAQQFGILTATKSICIDLGRGVNLHTTKVAW